MCMMKINSDNSSMCYKQTVIKIYSVRDSNGKPDARNERQLGVVSPTRKGSAGVRALERGKTP